MIETGKITNVWYSPLGSELVLDAAAGQATLVVDDAYDFNATGGTLRLTTVDDVTVDLIYTSADVDNDTITLSANLADLWPLGTQVAVLPLGQQKKAQVDLSDGDEGPIAIVPLSLDALLDDGIREPDEQEAVLVSDDSGRWEIMSVDDQQATVMGSSVSGEGLPVAGPTEPPPISPALKVTGTTNSLVIEALDEMPAGTTINYYVSETSGFVPDSTTLVSSTPSQVAVINTLSDGTLLVPDTTYYVVAVASNVLGSALPSAEVEAVLNLDNVDALVAARLVVGFILTGSIAVGQMTIDAATGITINAAGGGTILHFPVDGVSPLELTANVVAQSLNVQDNLTIAGGGTIYGNLQMANGIQDPATQPGLTSFYASYNTFLYTDGSDRSFYFADAIEQPDNPDWFVVAGTWWGLSDGTAGTKLLTFLRTGSGAFGSLIETATGASKSWQTNFQAFGGITYCNGDYFLLGQDLDRTSSWYIYRINGSSFNKTSEYRIGGSGAFNGYTPRLIADPASSRIAMLWIPGAEDLMLRWFGQDITAGPQGTDKILYNNLGGRGNVVAAQAGADGSGTNHIYVMLSGYSGDKSKAMAWTLATTPARASTFDFNRANGAKPNGLFYDSTHGNMLSVSAAGQLHTYGTYPNDKTITAEHAWYDADATGGTHESHVGPSRAYVLPARAQLSVSVPPPPDFTNPDSSNHDRANQVRLYISDTGGTTWKYRTFTTTPWSATMKDLTLLTTGTPNSGTAFPVAATPAILRSGATRLDGQPKTQIDGAGGGRFDGLVPPGCMMMWPGTSAPAGWLLCNGQAVSRATFADLKAALFDGTNHRYGNGDGSTTFNLPDFRARFPFGVNPGGSIASVPGAYETDGDGNVVTPGAGDEARMNHQHNHGLNIASDDLTQTKATNTTTGGGATRVTDLNGTVLGNHRHAGTTMDNAGVAGNAQNHAFLGVNFIIKY